MIFVEGPLGRVHAVMVFPRFGDHHHHRVGQGTTAQSQKLQTVVKFGRIAAVLQNNRKNLGQVVAKQLGGQHGLPGVHPVLVAAQGINFAVVDDVTVRVGALPAGKGVGAETRVDQTDRRLHARVGQVGVEAGDLARGQHAFVDQGLTRQAGHIEKFPARHVAVADRVGDLAPDDVQLALKGHVVRQIGAAADKNLADERLTRSGRLAQLAIVGWHIAPAQDGLALGPHDRLKALFARPALLGVRRQKDHTHPILARPGQLHVGAHRPQKTVRYLHQYPGPVAGVFLTPARSAMVEVLEDGQGLLDELVGCVALDVDNKADTAGVVLKRRVVQALLGGHG